MQVANHTGKTLEGQVKLDLLEDFAGEDASRTQSFGFSGLINSKWEEIKSGGLKDPSTFTGKIEWAGLDEGYFLTAVIPSGAPKSTITLSEPLDAQKKLAGPMVASLLTPVESLAAGQEAQFTYGLYFGPKDLQDLKLWAWIGPSTSAGSISWAVRCSIC